MELDPIPVDSTDKAWKTWNGPKAHSTGAANAWAPISADLKRDLVFIPTSSPSPIIMVANAWSKSIWKIPSLH
jgi:glucose dehydrogenase